MGKNNYNRNKNLQFNSRNSNSFTSASGLNKVNQMVDELMSMPEGSCNRYSSMYDQNPQNRSSFGPDFNNKGNSYNSVRDPILDDILREIRSTRADYNRIEKKLDLALSTAQSNKNEIVNLKSKVEQQEKRIVALEKINKTLTSTVTSSEKNVRESSLLFSGDLVNFQKESPPTALIENINRICLEEFECEVPITSISLCKKFVSPTNRKSVLLAFNDMSLRERILSKSIQTKKDGFFVNEYLTKENAKLLYDLRQLRRNNDVGMSVFSRAGIPCYKLHGPNQEVKRIFSVGDVTRLRNQLAQNASRISQTDAPELRRSQRIRNN